MIFGSPGSGKGTISKKIVKDFKFNHVSTGKAFSCGVVASLCAIMCHTFVGDLLRQHVLSGTPIGLTVKSIMDKGELVPDKMVLDMLLDFTNTNTGNVLVDGYPRTIAQAQSLQSHVPIDAVVALDVPHQTIIDRLSGRWIHPASGRTYAYDYNPPNVLGKDDATGEDDKPASIAARLEAYENLTMPLKKFYEEQGLLTVFSGTESDVIYPEVKKFLSTTMSK